jgi:hypothetical protein
MQHQPSLQVFAPNDVALENDVIEFESDKE